MTGTPAPWDMAEWSPRAAAFESWPTDVVQRAAGAAAAARMALDLARHGVPDLSTLPPTLRETWHLEEPLLALEVKYVSAATPDRIAQWLGSRGFVADDPMGAVLASLWADHVHRYVLPELAAWLERAPGPVPGALELVDAAARTWPLLDADSAAAVLRAAAAVAPEAARDVAAEVLVTPAAAWRVRRAALELAAADDGQPPLPTGAALLVAPGSGAARHRLADGEALAGWLAHLLAAADGAGGVRLTLEGPADAAATALVRGVRAAVHLAWPSGATTGWLRRAQHGLGLWLPGVRLADEAGPSRVPTAWAARAAVLAGGDLAARAVLATSGPCDAVAEQLYRAEPGEWSEFGLPKVLWLPGTTPREVTDPMLELAGVRLERLDDGSVLTVSL